jgi:DUF177 domain-containing protein
VAKLARLMQPGPPQFIDPTRLAETRDGISGYLDIGGMLRLHELLSKKEGSVGFELRFDKDERNRIRISGEYSTSLCMECQRCLQAVEVEIAGLINVALLAHEDEAANLPKEVDPLILKGRELSLQMFFEDELLLGLPLSPSHDTDACHAQDPQNPEKNENRQHPFAVLKDLKLKNSKD